MYSRFFLPFPKDPSGAAADPADSPERDEASLRAARAADGADDDDAAGSGEDESIESAGRRYLEGLPPEDRARPFQEEPEDRPAPAEAATEVDDEIEDEASADEPVVRDDDGAEWRKVGGSWRWVLEGKFVEGEPPEGWTAPVAAAPAAATKATSEKGKGADAKAKDGQAAPKLAKLTLPGERDRGEEDIEVEVDEELAERIRRMQKGGLRRQAFERRKAELDARQSEMDAVSLELEQDPVGFIVNQMTPERRLEVARALVVEHLPELAPDIEKWLDNDGTRQEERVTLRDRMSESNRRLDHARQARAYAQKCMAAAEGLIPEDIDDDVAQEFMTDARRVLHEAAKAGTKVTPDNVKELLARRVRLYGFDRTRRPAAPRARDTSSTSASSSRGRDVRDGVDDTPTARPVTDRARQVAEQGRPTRAEAQAAQDRIRRVQRARTASQRQAPAGAGAGPVEVPVLKPEDEADVRTASKALRQRGLPESWTQAQ